MFVKASFSKSIILKFKSMFEPNVLKLIIKKKLSINEKYFKNLYDNPNYYASLVDILNMQNEVLKIFHSFGWLF